MIDRTISEGTRRNIADALVLNNVNWAGRFGEHEFLARLYKLKDMRSTDDRFTDAAGDIWQHRDRNPNDWNDDWVFYDMRFQLLQAPDEEFLRFLCEMLHPIVQPDADEVERILEIVNPHLANDGWQIREQARVSGRPIFAAVRLLDIGVDTCEVAQVVADSTGADYVRRQITRMQSGLANDPDGAIGTAKDFIETVCKTILSERAVEYDPNEKMPKLVKQALGVLELVPKGVTNQAKAAETVKRLLSGFNTLGAGLAELRNLHGTGHGKEAGTKGLPLRHARLAVSAATTLAVFLWETHQETQ